MHSSFTRGVTSPGTPHLIKNCNTSMNHLQRSRLHDTFCPLALITMTEAFVVRPSGNAHLPRPSARQKRGCSMTPHNVPPRERGGTCRGPQRRGRPSLSTQCSFSPELSAACSRRRHKLPVSITTTHGVRLRRRVVSVACFPGSSPDARKEALGDEPVCRHMRPRNSET